MRVEVIGTARLYCGDCRDMLAGFPSSHVGSRLPDASCWLVWDKRDGATSDHQVDCELAWTNLRGPARLFSHKWRGMVRAGEENVSRGQRRVHPTQKPIALMDWVLKQCRLQAGTTVLDPYMGSGTTGIAAMRLGLPFIGIEIDPVHFERACARLREERQALPLFAGAA